jgi:hypothetical protein
MICGPLKWQRLPWPSSTRSSGRWLAQTPSPASSAYWHLALKMQPLGRSRSDGGWPGMGFSWPDALLR